LNLSPEQQKQLSNAAGMAMLAAVLADALKKGYAVTLEPAGDPRAWLSLCARAARLIDIADDASRAARPDMRMGPEWRGEAVRFRDDYHALLANTALVLPDVAAAGKES
jgi:hypothetical protein